MNKKRMANILTLGLIAVLITGCNVQAKSSMEIMPETLGTKEEDLLKRLAGEDAKPFEYRVDDSIQSYKIHLLRLREDKKWEIATTIAGNVEKDRPEGNLLIYWKNNETYQITEGKKGKSNTYTAKFDANYLKDMMGSAVHDLQHSVKIQPNQGIVLQYKTYTKSNSMEASTVNTGSLADFDEYSKTWDAAYATMIVFFDKPEGQHEKWTDERVVETNSIPQETPKPAPESEKTEAIKETNLFGEKIPLDSQKPNSLIIKNALLSGDVKRTTLLFNAGNLEIYKATGDEIELQYYISYNNDLTEQEIASLEKLQLEMKLENQVLLLNTVQKKETFQSLFGVNKLLFDSSKAAIKMRLGLPESVQELALANNVGNVTISDIAARLQLQVNVGDVKIKNFTPLQSAIFNVNVGLVSCEIKDLSQSYEIISEVNVGDIQFQFPKGADYSVTGKALTQDEESRVDAAMNQLDQTMDKDPFGAWEAVAPVDKLQVISRSSVGTVKYQ